MRRISSLLIIVLISLSASAQKEKKVLFVIVDGISADVIEKQPTPSLDAIAGKKGYTRAYVGGEKGGYSQTPTISAVGYNSLLTGTWVNKHNVFGNDIKAPNYNYWTIFRFFKTQYPQKKTAIFSSWLDNRTKLVGEGLPATGNYQFDHSFDGLELDTVTFPHDRLKSYMSKIDQTVVDSASLYIREQAPDLSWVYLEYTDDMGHMYGDSPEFFRAVADVDSQMGKLWAAIQHRQQKFNEDWQIYITTDHGRDEKTGKHHGGQSDRERSTWIVTNNQAVNAYFKTGTAGIVDIMPTIARFMNVQIPRERLMEIDGVPLSGAVSITHPTAVLDGGKINLTWKAADKKGNAKIWVSTTNHFKEGGEDQYELKATVPVSKQMAAIDVSGMPSGFYKIVIEGPDNMVNRWIVAGDKK